MSFNRAKNYFVVFGVILLNGLGSSPVTAVTFTTSGKNLETGGGNVAASASFTVSGSNLVLVLTNTGTATPGRVDALTGIIWDMNGANPGLPLMNAIQLTNPGSGAGQDQVFTDGTTGSSSSILLNATWTYKLASPRKAAYGVSTTGFGGVFSAPFRGTGGTDYGIVADGTFPNANPPSSFGSAFPLIQNSLTFTFSGASGLDASNITNVKFLFGTSGDGLLNGINADVPEPGTMAFFASFGVCCGGLLMYRRHRTLRQTK